MAKIVNELERVKSENIEMKKMISFILNTLRINEMIVFNDSNKQFEIKQ